MIRECQHNRPGTTQEDIIQNVASQSAMMIFADSEYASNTALQRDLRETISRSTTVNYRPPDNQSNAKSTTTSMSLAQAYVRDKLDKKGITNSQSVASIKKSVITNNESAARDVTAKTSFIPENKTFISNKNNDYTPPPPHAVISIPNSSNRKTRNSLSVEPMNFHNHEETDPYRDAIEESL
jgi:hypothetical protein